MSGKKNNKGTLKFEDNPRNNMDAAEYNHGSRMGDISLYGVIFDTTTTRILEGYTIVFPKAKIIKLFNQLIEPLVTKIMLKQEQVISLNDIRDLLLPQFISGRLHIPISEKFLEEQINEN